MLILHNADLRQSCSSYFWGTLSDRWGRKPVILVSNVVTAVAGVGFGLAPNLGLAIAARMLGEARTFRGSVRGSTCRLTQRLGAGGLFNGSGV